MRDFLSVSARMLALALGVAFIVVTPLGLLAFNLERQVFNPQAYKRALLAEQVYDRIPTLIAGQLSDSLPGSESGMPLFFRNLEQDDWEIILSGLMPPEWLQAQAESAFDQVFHYLDSTDPSLSLRISLVELKVRMQGEPGMRAFLQMLIAQPACTEIQLLQIAQAALLGSLEDLPLCQPPEGLVDKFRPEIQAVLRMVAAEIPDEVELGSQLMEAGGDFQDAGLGDDPRPALRQTRLLIRLSLLLPVVLLLGVSVFAVRSLRAGLLWWGALLLLAGLASAMLGALAAPILSQYLVKLFSGGAGLPPVLTQEVVGVGRALIGGVVRSMIIQAGVLTVVGAAFALLGLLIRPRPAYEI